MIEIIVTFTVVFLVLTLLAFSKLSSDAVTMGALTFLLLSGILTPVEAFSGFANTGVLTIGFLFIVASGLKETGAFFFISNRLLKEQKSYRHALIKLLIITASFSAFLNNTAIVAMFIPIVQDWSKKIKISTSMLLIPLSYASILGGTITIIGTSTNLVINGLMIQNNLIPFSMFEISYLGLSVFAIGSLYLLIFSRYLLPNRDLEADILEDVKTYTVEVELSLDSPQVGKSISQAGLRNLKFSYLIEIERKGKLMPAVSPDTVLEVGDLLFFVGDIDGADELRKIKGLQPAKNHINKLNADPHERDLIEAVISSNFDSIGESVKDSKFRTHYNAVILSIYRQGERIKGKIGDIKFQAGDTLLLEADHHFIEKYRLNSDFLLLGHLTTNNLKNSRKAPIAILILLGVILSSAFGFMDILESSLLGAAAMILTGCISIANARNSLDLSILVTIAASFALGAAITKTGGAELVSSFIVKGIFTSITPWVGLYIVYWLTVLFTEFITNNAAAVLMFPIALSLSKELNVSVVPFAVAVMFAASASFITPIGYQTNLMVQNVGMYKFSDFVKIGFPMSLLLGHISVILIPYFWNF